MSNIKDELRHYIDRDWVSFAELQRHWPDQFAKHDGDDFRTMLFPGMGDTIIWPCVSLEFRTALGELMDNGEIILQPGDALSYFIDGSMLKIPIAKQKRVYKRLHWLPCFLRPAATIVPTASPTSRW